MLIGLPIPLVIVLSSQLLAVDSEQRPAADITEPRLFKYIEIWVFDGDAFGFEGGDDGITEWHLAESLSCAKDASFSYCLY